MESTEKDLGVPSVNTQVAAGIIFTGLFMIGVNRKLRIIIDNQKSIYNALWVVNDGIDKVLVQSTTVRDVVKLAAKSETGTGV